MTATPLSIRLRKAGVLLAVALFVLFTYTLLHEGGHAIVGLLAGQRLVEFDVNFFTLSAHVGMAGDIAGAWRTLQAVAGVGLPILVWTAFILAVPRRGNPLLELVKTLSTLGVLNSALPWIIFPLLVALGQAPPRDDVLSFMDSSGVAPLLLAAAAAAVYVAGWTLYLARIGGVRQEVELLISPGAALEGTGTRPTLVALLGTLAAGLALVLGLRLALGAPDPFAPPPGYELAATVNLTQQAHSAGSVCGFSLEQPAEVGIYVLITDIDTPYIDIALRGPGGFRSPILHGEGYHTNTDRMNPRLQLEPGEYRVVISSEQSPGTVSVYLDLD